MAASFLTKNATGQRVPFVNLSPAIDVVANLPAAANCEGQILLLAASTSPGGACLVISDGTNWYPVAISGTQVS